MTKLNSTYREFFKAARQHVIQREWEYAAYAYEMSLAGFAPEYCPHGAYLWSDYDPICGACEEPASITERATALARQWLAEYDGMMADLVSVLRMESYDPAASRSLSASIASRLVDFTDRHKSTRELADCELSKETRANMQREYATA